MEVNQFYKELKKEWLAFNKVSIFIVIDIMLNENKINKSEYDILKKHCQKNNSLLLLEDCDFLDTMINKTQI